MTTLNKMLAFAGGCLRVEGNLTMAEHFDGAKPDDGWRQLYRADLVRPGWLTFTRTLALYHRHYGQKRLPRSRSGAVVFGDNVAVTGGC